MIIRSQARSESEEPGLMNVLMGGDVKGISLIKANRSDMKWIGRKYKKWCL